MSKKKKRRQYEKASKKTSIDFDSRVDVIYNGYNDNSSSTFNKEYEEALYNLNKKENIYSKYITVENTDVDIVSARELKELGIDTRNDKNKIKKINDIAMYHITTNDMIGKIIDTLENNINANIKLNFDSNKKSKKTIRTKAEKIINEFNQDIDLENILSNIASQAYSTGNHLMYLRDKGDSYVVDTYPLDIYEASDYLIDGEHSILINARKLKGKINKAQSKYKTKSGKSLFFESFEDELKATYPEEVAEAILNGDTYAKLDMARVGNVRINNMGRKYGVTPLFRTFKPLRNLDIFENSNNATANANAKKILAQIFTEKVLGNDGKTKPDINMFIKANDNFEKAMRAARNKDVAYITGFPGVTDIKYVEPKSVPIDITLINAERNKVLTALGIGFLNTDAKASYVVAEINIKELMKTINKICKQIQSVLKKWYRLILSQNGIDEDYVPEVDIIDSELLEMDLRIKLATTIFDKFGASYKTVYQLLGMNPDEEMQRRREENEEKGKDEFGNDATGIDKTLMYPRVNGNTVSGKTINENQNNPKDTSKVEDENKFDKTDENKNIDTNKSKVDKKRYEKQTK